jgi:DNA-binding XRE family transcriptional regulator
MRDTTTKENSVVYDKKTNERHVETLVSTLGALRKLLGFSQGVLADIIGMGRQTLLAIENKQRKMRWDTFLALVTIFSYNEKTEAFMRTLGIHLENISPIVAKEISDQMQSHDTKKMEKRYIRNSKRELQEEF